MKKIFVLILLFLFSNSFNLFAQQYYYTFSELKGMEDNYNNTHLFYRLYTYRQGGPILADYSENSIYHLDKDSNQDSLFLFSGGFIGDSYSVIADWDFWNNNPSEYILVSMQCSVDCDVYIWRFDEESPSYSEYGFGSSIKISRQNDSLVFATANFNLKSTDGGRSWIVFDSTNRSIISLNPYNDDIFSGDYYSIYKSTDGGVSFSKVDTFAYSYSSKFFYDRDSIHIYNLLDNRLRVSDADGNAYSWTERYSSSNPIYVSVDYSQSGSLYLADWKYIYHSTDYGATFSEYKTLNRRIVGIYKKPDSDKLYAETKYDLYEITADSIKVIKSLQPDPSLADYYPLQIGDKWVYENTVCYFDYPPVGCDHYNSIVQIIGDTTLSNGFKYYILKETNTYGSSYNFERYNQEDATVRRYAGDSSLINSEYIIEDFLTDVGDTSCMSRFDGFNCYAPKIFLSETSDYVFGLYLPSKKYEVQDLDWHRYSLVKGFGIDSITFGFDFGYAVVNLKGCIINGVLYGDTTVVGINDPDNAPKEFSLFQNYPNPFNPTTKIKFVIPQSSFVNLTVYDVLGREVTTLVNEEKHPGIYEVEFNGSNLSSGIYFYVLNIGNKTLSKKMCLIK